MTSLPLILFLLYTCGSFLHSHKVCTFYIDIFLEVEPLDQKYTSHRLRRKHMAKLLLSKMETFPQAMCKNAIPPSWTNLGFCKLIANNVSHFKFCSLIIRKNELSPNVYWLFVCMCVYFI